MKYYSKVSFFILYLFIIQCSSEKRIIISNKNLTEIPNLSQKTKTEYLDLSNNKISKFDEKRLPPNLKKINISNNKLIGEVILNIGAMPNLSFIDLSNNRITDFYSYSENIDTILINNNNLKVLYIRNSKKFNTERQMSYLDISDNKNLSNGLDFMPTSFKTIKHNNISKDSTLYFKMSIQHK